MTERKHGKPLTRYTTHASDTVPKPRGRPKNPRRVVLPELRQIAAWTRSMIGIWGQSMNVWDPENAAKGKFGWRPMRDDEKPENRAQRWHQLAEYMVAIIAKAEEIHEYALDQKRKIENGANQ